MQSPRLLRPWGFPGKSTGVGCPFLLQGNLPDLGIEPGSPALQADTLPSCPDLTQDNFNRKPDKIQETKCTVFFSFSF